MALSIGNMSAVMSLNGAQLSAPPKRLADSKFATFAATEKAEPTLLTEAPDTLKAGFGEGSVSSFSAAVRALDSNLEGTRKIIPTVGQTSDRVRARLSQQRALQTRELRIKQFKGNGPEAALQVQRFTKALGETSDTVKARPDGTEAVTQEKQRDIQRNGETVRIARQTAQPSLDVLA